MVGIQADPLLQDAFACSWVHFWIFYSVPLVSCHVPKPPPSNYREPHDILLTGSVNACGHTCTPKHTLKELVCFSVFDSYTFLVIFQNKLYNQVISLQKTKVVCILRSGEFVNLLRNNLHHSSIESSIESIQKQSKFPLCLQEMLYLSSYGCYAFGG